MDTAIESLWAMSAPELLEAYYKARRLHAEKKFARDTERGRLEWLRAKTFAAGAGRVTERQYAVDASEELAKKGQHVREMSLEVDLIKSDVDVIAACLRLRGMSFSAPATDDVEHGEAAQEGSESS